MANLLNHHLPSVSVGQNSAPEELPDNLYRESLSPVSNPQLTQAFHNLFLNAESSMLEPSQLLQSVTANLAEKGVDLPVSFSDRAWPVKFDKDAHSLLIHPVFLEICKPDRNARLFAVTEIFDRMIHALLYIGAATGNERITSIFPCSRQELLALDQIKDVKQCQSEVLEKGRSDGASLDDLQLVVDPQSAWLVACPQYGLESTCAVAFDRCLSRYYALDKANSQSA